MERVKIGCILLAAGQSRRFGNENKLLFELWGKAFVRYALDPLPLDLVTEAVMVVSDDEVLEYAKKYGVKAVFNEQSENGISTSIEAGISATGAVDGYMFVTCDQPFRKESSIRRLISLFSENPDKIIAASHNGVRGNPVIFPKDLKGELLLLEGDNGGGTVLAKHPERLLLCEVDDEAEMLDIDSRQDFEKLINIRRL